MNLIISIILLVFGILQIVLFFKIWGMTNDIRDIKNKYLSSDHIITRQDGKGITQNLLVVELKTERQMRLGEKLPSGKYKCYSDGMYVGDFAQSEFMEFDKWVNEVYKK